MTHFLQLHQIEKLSHNKIDIQIFQGFIISLVAQDFLLSPCQYRMNFQWGIDIF